MIQAGALLYRITGRKRYLSEAQATAAACLTHFFRPVRKPGGGSVRILRRDKIWFDAVMLRGFIELYREDGRDAGLNAFRETLDHAWSHARDTGGFWPTGAAAAVRAASGCFRRPRWPRCWHAWRPSPNKPTYRTLKSY